MTRIRVPNWLQYPDDGGEHGYVDSDSAELCPACAGYGEVLVDRGSAPWMETTVECGLCDTHGFLHAETREPLVPARCSTCNALVPDDAPRPLCRAHDAAYRAGGRSEDERVRQERAAAGA